VTNTNGIEWLFGGRYKYEINEANKKPQSTALSPPILKPFDLNRMIYCMPLKTISEGIVDKHKTHGSNETELEFAI
jgi:hypothetical protein